MLLMTFAGFACSRDSADGKSLPAPATDLAPSEDSDGPSTRTAVLAGGCFWCTEAVFEQLDGVTNVISGYAGGSDSSANYEAVASGSTDHAEVIQITYDPSKTSYGQLLKVFFSVAHDPTQLNQQGPDTGRQYRSAVFYANDEEKRMAEAYIRRLEEAKVYDKPIVTTLEPLVKFHPAESYHQDYVRQNPHHPYVVMNALPKVRKVEKQFADQVRRK